MTEQPDKPVSAQELETILNKVLTERPVAPSTESDEVHETEHDFVKEMIKRRQRTTARWEKFKRSAIGAIAVALVGWGLAGLTFFGDYIMRIWK